MQLTTAADTVTARHTDALPSPPPAAPQFRTLTQQQQLYLLGRLYAILFEITLDQATPGGCGSLLGRLCAAHGAYCLDAKRFEGRLISAK